MTLPPLEPRSNTLDAIDAIAERAASARQAVLDEVAYLGAEIDRLRSEYEKMRRERDSAIEALQEVLRVAR